jgi:hypothetical protein
MRCEACGDEITSENGPALWGTRVVVSSSKGSITVDIEWCFPCLHIAYDAIEKAKERAWDA